MSHRKLNILIFAIAASVCIISCKKDDETKVTPALSGALSFNVPEYVSPNTTLTLTPSGVTHPKDEGLGYYWKVNPTKPKADTTRYENGLDKNGKPSDGSFTFTFSDTLQTCTISGYAYAKGYSYTMKSVECTVVEGGIDRSITNLGLADKPSIEVNGIVYPYVSIAGLDWLCRNIADKSAGAPYRNSEEMSDVFGRYYSFEDAQKVCPEGWRLPTDAEWVTMVSEFTDSEGVTPYSPVPGVAAALMADATFNGNEMWQYYPNVGDITNVSGLAVIPSGYVVAGKNFAGLNEYAMFWTADVVEGESDMAYYRYLVCDQSDLFASKGSRTSFGASVRCVREAQ